MRTLAHEITGSFTARMAGITALRKEVAGELKEAQARLQEMGHSRQAFAAQQQAALNQGRTELAQEETHRQAQAQSWLKVVADDRAAAGQQWQEMASTLNRMRAGGTVAQAPRQATTEPTASQERVFAFLAEHPDGARLADLEHEFRLNRLLASRVVKSLVNNGKVQKRGLLYFAI
jgi:hypothetical protein